MKEPYEILKWDTQFFGYPVARIYPNDLSQVELRAYLLSLKTKVRLVYYAAANKVACNHVLLKEFNGLLVDDKTTFYKDVSPGFNSNANIVEYQNNFEQEELIQLGIESGIYSRYKIDPNIENTKFKALYSTWIINSLNHTIADKVLIYTEDSTALGIVTLGNKCSRADIGIVAVNIRERGKGIGRSLLKAAEQISYENGFTEIQVVTQGANKPACALYISCGYRVEKVEYFYHFWL